MASYYPPDSPTSELPSGNHPTSLASTQENTISGNPESFTFVPTTEDMNSYSLLLSEDVHARTNQSSAVEGPSDLAPSRQGPNQLPPVDLREFVQGMSQGEIYTDVEIQNMTDAASGEFKPNTIEWYKVYVKILSKESEMLKQQLLSRRDKPPAIKLTGDVKQTSTPPFTKVEPMHQAMAVTEGGDSVVIEHLRNQLRLKNKQFAELESVNKEWVKYRQRTDKEAENLRAKLRTAEQSVTEFPNVEGGEQSELLRVQMQHEGEMDYLNRELEETRRQCMTLTGQLKQVTSELTMGKAQHRTSLLNTGDIHGDNSAVNLQLKTFKEDFDREHAEAVQLKQNNTGLTTKNSTLQIQVTNLQLQLRTTDSFRQKAVDENEASRQQLSETKRKLRSTEQTMQSKTMECERLQLELNAMSKKQGPNAKTFTAGSRQSPLQFNIPPFFAGNYPEMTNPPSPDTWTCTHCTFKNSPVRTVCELCGSIYHPISARYSGQRAPNSERSNAAPNSERSNAAPNSERSNAAPNSERSNAAPNSEQSNAAPNSERLDDEISQVLSMFSTPRVFERLVSIGLRNTAERKNAANDASNNAANTVSNNKPNTVSNNTPNTVSNNPANNTSNKTANKSEKMMLSENYHVDLLGDPDQLTTDSGWSIRTVRQM